MRIKSHLAKALSGILYFIFYYSGLIYLIRFIRCKILKEFRIIVVLYHHVGECGQNDYGVGTDLFNKQMAYLKKYFKVISIEEMLRIKNTPLDADYAVITFDDGYKCNMLNALPILEKYGFKATLFLTINYLENIDPRKKGWYLCYSDLDVLKGVFSFGAHTISHPSLTQISKEKQIEEIFSSKEKLQQRIGCGINYFAYPYGVFNEAIKGLTAEAGYQCAFTILDGTNNSVKDNFLLKRKDMRRRPFYFFIAKVEGINEFPLFSLIQEIYDD